MADGVAAAGDAMAGLRQPLEDPELVGNFMEQAMSLSLRAGRNLPDEGQHLGVHAIGGRQRRRRVQEAGTRHHAKCLRLAGCQRRAGGHVGGALFMARLDRRYGVSVVEKRIEELVVLDPGQAIKLVDPVCDKGLYGEAGNCSRHR